jgi:hypothetical protein
LIPAFTPKRYEVPNVQELLFRVMDETNSQLIKKASAVGWVNRTSEQVREGSLKDKINREIKDLLDQAY